MLFVPLPRLGLPNGRARINRAHPSAAGVVGALVASQHGLSFYDPLMGNAGKVGTSPLAESITNRGFALGCGLSDQNYFVPLLYGSVGNGPCSLLAVTQGWDDSSTKIVAQIRQSTNSWDGPRFERGFDGNARYRAGAFREDGIWLADTVNIVPGAIDYLVLSDRPGQQYFWRNGKLIATDTASGNRFFGATPNHLNHGGQTNAPRVLLMIAWNRALAKEEGFALSVPDAVWAMIRAQTPDELAWFSVPTGQFLRPISDVSIGGWTTDTGGTTNLYAAIDETTFNDADFIQSSVNPSADTVEVQLTTAGDPGIHTGHIIRYRISGDGGSVNVTVQLRQGAATLIKEWVHTNVSTIENHAQTLTEGEAGNITDYSDLRLRAIANP